MYTNQVAPWAQQTAQMTATIGINEAPRDLSAIDAAMNSLYNGLEEAHCRMDVLEQRLSSVLQPAMPQPVGDNAKLASAPPPTSPLVSGMRSQQARLDQLISRINDLRNRLDS